ncbi:radical SAM protein [Candidatus Woesearchaeota archaeon]|nr:radical SAM protein [Candidatus Woesearchaeota archaeon]
MIVKIERGFPLVGCIAFGILDRGTNLLQVRPTSVCNINCTFCSVDGGPLSVQHKVFYEVDCEYLLEEVAKIVAIKGNDVEINLDSVGEPFCYPYLEKLVLGLREIQGVQKISIQTNGTLLKDVAVDVVNLSFHAMDAKLAKQLANSPCMDIEKVKDFGLSYKQKGITVRLCPVWIPGVNDEEIPKIILFAKEAGFLLGIQKYEVYAHSRKHEKVKAQNWYQFYSQIKKWEKEFQIPLQVTAKELGIHRAPRIPEAFKKGERVQLEVRAKGWFEGQMIAVGRGRCVSVQHCEKNEGDLVNVKILESKNNISLAE